MRDDPVQYHHFAWFCDVWTDFIYQSIIVEEGEGVKNGGVGGADLHLGFQALESVERQQALSP